MGVVGLMQCCVYFDLVKIRVEMGRQGRGSEFRKVERVQIKSFVLQEQVDFVKFLLGDISGFYDLYFESYSGYGVWSGL